MRSIKLLICITLLSIAASGQNGATVSGYVGKASPPYDAKGLPFPDVTVTLVSENAPSLKFTTTTDNSGNYKFENVPYGDYVISVRSGDASLQSPSASIRVAGGVSNSRNFLLNSVPGPACVDCGIRETVTISAAVGQTLEQVSKSVDVIDSQQMRDRADFALIESLRTIPGFRVQQSGGFGRLATVKTRGLRNSDTALLIDGIRFRDAAAITGDASPFISDFTLTSVSKVEVLRGSGSSLYGTNAIGGVIDFQTPEARSGTHGQLSVNGGGLGFGRFRGNLSHGTQGGKFGISAGMSETVYANGIDDDDRAENTNVQTRVDIKPTSRTNISGRIFFSDANVRLNVNPDTLGTLPGSNANVIDAVPNVNFIPDRNDPDHGQRSRSFSGQITFDHAFNDEFLLSGFYQGLRTRRLDTNGPLAPGFQPFPGPDTDRFAGLIQTVNGRFTWSPSAKSRLTGGYEFESDDFENGHDTPIVVDRFSVHAKQTSNTLFVQELLSFDDGRLQIAGGFRAQLFSLKKPVFTPSTNSTYQNLTLTDPPNAYTADGSVSYYFPSSGTKLRAHVGNGYRVASLYERFGTFYSDLFGYSNSGDPNLAPERSVAFDAGIEQDLLNHRVRLTGTYFYTDVRKAIDFAFCVPRCLASPDPLNRFSGYYNTDGRVARGVETSADINPTRTTRIFTSYTFTNSDDRNPLNLFQPTSPGIPSHIFTLMATQRFGRAWVNFDLAATSSYLFPFYNFSFVTFEEKYYTYRFKGSRKGDLTGGYTFPLKNDQSLRVYGTIENIFGQEYYENGFRTAGAVGRVGVSFGF